LRLGRAPIKDVKTAGEIGRRPL